MVNLDNPALFSAYAVPWVFWFLIIRRIKLKHANIYWHIAVGIAIALMPSFFAATISPDKILEGFALTCVFFSAHAILRNTELSDASTHDSHDLISVAVVYISATGYLLLQLVNW